MSTIPKAPPTVASRASCHSLLLLSLVAGWLLAGCVSSGNPSADVLRLATTTSARDSGLLEVLLPEFEAANRCRVDVVAVGTGAALKLGETGDADAVLVHARPAELAFMEAGFGIRHEEFMFNEFVLVGPPADAAGIKGLEPVAALRKLAATKSPFISRGDESGTHQREQDLWQAAGIVPDWPDFLESGQGMGASLTLADEKRSYILCDIGTYLNMRDKLDLVPLTVSADSMRNPYAIIVVNPKTHPQVNSPLANALADYLISPATQQKIADYQIAGEKLFTPTRLKAEN